MPNLCVAKALSFDNAAKRYCDIRRGRNSGRDIERDLRRDRKLGAAQRRVFARKVGKAGIS